MSHIDVGLKWQEEYHMQKILADAGITPGGQYKPKNMIFHGANWMRGRHTKMRT